MSAMPARQPRLTPISTKTRRLGRLAAVNSRAVVTPIAQAIPINIPKGRASLAAAESTDNLVTAARTLGMVPAETPVFIRISDQTVVGQAVPAKAPVVPYVPAPAATPAR